MKFVELMHQVQLAALFGKRSVWVADVLDQFVDRRKFCVDTDTLVNTGKEGRLPIGAASGRGSSGPQRDVARHILVFGSQPVKHPRTHAGPRQPCGTRVHENGGHLVGWDIRVHGSNYSEVIDQLTELGKHFADLDSRTASGREFKRRSHGDTILAWNGFAIILSESRFGIPGVYVRGSALGENMHDMFGFRRKM